TYYKHKVESISLDIMARTRAISLVIKTNSLLGKDKAIFDLDFIKYIDINFEDLEYLDKQEIIKFDKDCKPYNFSYCFKVRHSD
ncbi:phosphate starvation-inducible protein PhoH, partial [Aliarcobacter butzleri]